MEKNHGEEPNTRVAHLKKVTFQIAEEKEEEDENEDESNDDEDKNKTKNEEEEKQQDIEPMYLQEDEKGNETHQKQKEKQKMKNKKEKGARILGIGAILIAALVFAYALVGLALWGGVRLLNVSNQASEPAQYKTSDRTLAVSLLVFAPISLFLLTFGILWVLVSWRKQKMTKGVLKRGQKGQKKETKRKSKNTKNPVKSNETTAFATLDKNKKSELETDSDPSDDEI